MVRPAGGPPLSPIRSLAYFQPVIGELLSHRPPDYYLEYRRLKLRHMAADKGTTAEAQEGTNASHEIANSGGGIHEDGLMIITQEIFKAYLRCPTKSHLFCRPDLPAATTGQKRRPEEDPFQQGGSSRLRASVPDHEVYTGTPTAETIKRKMYRMILDYTALATDLRAHLHGLELVHAAGTKNLSVDQYIPIRFVSAERISVVHRFLLAFDALVFSQAVSTPLPHTGKLVHGRGYSTTTVLLTPLYAKVRSVIAAIWAQQASPTPPPIVLNKHCAQCQYASRCRQIAMEADDLSLLAKISTKERQGYHEKGIFTVKQLSYTFRPLGDHLKTGHL